MDVLLEMLSYPFMPRAIIVGALVSLTASLLGVSLVLKRYAMIGDGLSHVGFCALAIATALHTAPLTVAIPVVVGAAFLLLRFNDNDMLKGDAAIAVISTGSLAVGVMILSMTTGMNVDVCNYLFGSILAMSKTDVYLSVSLSLAAVLLFAVSYHKIFAITFDEPFARAAGINVNFYNLLLAMLTAITIVLGMRMLGALLISALIIFPALTAMRLAKKFFTVTVVAVAVAEFCFFSGLTVSCLRALPTGASIVILNIFCLIAAVGWRRWRQHRNYREVVKNA